MPNVLLALVLALALMVSSCVSDGILPPPNYPYPELAKKHKPRWHWIMSSPSRISLISKAPPGPYGFRVGWRDSCDMAMKATASPFYKPFLMNRKDYVFSKTDPDYDIGWGVGFWYCSRYQEVYNFRGNQKYPGFM